MPPEQIEMDITGRFERFFTLASNIEHIESRSLPGVSLIKIFFKPGTDADSAVTSISNLAMANLRRLPPGTLPMAMKLGEGSESYAPLAQAIIGGLTMSLILTVFIVPAAYLVAYRSRESEAA